MPYPFVMTDMMLNLENLVLLQSHLEGRQPHLQLIAETPLHSLEEGITGMRKASQMTTWIHARPNFVSQQTTN